jgi:hyperosmotically inducible periplasmic protein
MNTPKTLIKARSFGIGTAAAIALSVAASTAVGGPPDDDALQAVKDAWIDGRLETAYALNRHLNPFAIDTHVEDGVVTLSGTVDSEIDRDLAIEIAEGIDQVSTVRSELQVDPDGASARTEADSGRSFGQWVKDVTTTARVKSSLVANGSTQGLAIDVDTTNDVVTLSGQVKSIREKSLAEMIARNTEGTVGVENKLEVDERS